MADTCQPIFFTESSKNLGGQELQLIQQMIELEKRSIKTALRHFKWVTHNFSQI